MHYEVELGLVMGKRLRDLDVEDEQGAMGAISSESSRSGPNSIRHLDPHSDTMCYLRQATSSQST